MAANRKNTRATMETSCRRPLRLALLAGVSLLPMAGDLILATRAEATACGSNTIVSSCTNLYISSGTGLATISGTISGNNTAVNVNDASVGTLANSGLVSGTSIGIRNYENTINTLINSGTITSTGGDVSYGIFNRSGHINNLTNTTNATISANSTVIRNTGTIGNLTNNGHLNGGSGLGISNVTLASIGSIDNGTNATLQAVDSAIKNDETIGTLTNEGLITSSGDYAIYNDDGFITSIDNGTNATIAASSYAAIYEGGSIGSYEAGSIGTLTNAGVIKSTGSYAIEEYDGTITSINNGAGATILSTNYAAIYNDNGEIGTVTNNGLISSGASSGIDNDSTITLINNGTAGTISGASTAIYNDESIGTLTNSGQITSTNKYAIYNSDSIASIDNIGTSATISSHDTAIFNEDRIGTLTNSGLIKSTDGFGIYSENTISSIDNTTGGIISGNTSGLRNASAISTLTNEGTIESTDRGGISNNGVDASITALTNSGLISGGSAGINNNSGSTLVTLTNSGTVTGPSTGLYNESHISLVTNSGTIGGTASVGVVNGTYTSSATQYVGLIGTLSNSGTISGTVTGVRNFGGSIGTISNSGLISGAASGLYGAGIVNKIAVATGTYTSDVVIRPFVTTLSSNGTISTISNSGTITGITGIYNDDIISQIINNGDITGTTFGVYNDYGGTIGYVENEGQYGTINSFLNDNTIGVDVATAFYNANEASIGTVTNNGTITGTDDALNNYEYASIGTLINNQFGSINGGVTGVENDDHATIGTLSNNGAISGEFAAISNITSSTINVLTIGGYGTLVGGSDGVLNESYSSIGTFTNSGTITGDLGVGVDNYNNGIIGTLDNTGVLEGSSTGVVNSSAGTIDTLINSGTIAGSVGDAGIGNYYDAVIGTLDNTGTILSDDGAIYNGEASTIGGLTNSGQILGTFAGIYNDSTGSIFGVGNSGTISGATDGFDNGGLVNGVANTGLIAATGTAGSGLNGAAVVGLHNEVGGSIGVVSNLTGGTISGGSSGVYNLGVIDTLTNAGIITGGSSGVDNEGTVGALTNSGTITGGSSGVDNEGGTIGTLINTGTITGTAGAGIYNSYRRDDNTILGTIGLLGNAGLIAGGATGIYNANLISAITNSGTISGGTGDGILNDSGGTIDMIQNFASGKILGGVDGVNAGGGTVSISNAGVIKGVAGYGVVINSGTLTNLAGGTISGTTGVEITGNNATVFDAGTIISTDGGNAILVAPLADPAQIVLTTGSAITGTINGGGTDGSITLEGTGSLPNTVTGFTTGSTLTVAPGAKWTGSGSWTVATVTNNGTFEGGTLGTPLTLTGNYVQTAGGTLLVVVTPTVTTKFIIKGTASLEGTLDYAFAPGTYTDKTYSFITATGGISGAFSAANYTGAVPPVLLHTTKGVTDAADLILSGTSVANSKPIVIVTPEDDSIYADAGQAAAQAAQEANAGVLDYVTDEALTTDPSTGYGFANESASPFGNHYEATLLGAPASTYGATSNSGGACAAGGSVPPSGVNTTGSQMANAFAAGFCGAGGWLEGSVGASNVNGSGDASDYSTNSGGFLAGVDKVVNPTGTRLGIAVGYDETWLHDSASGKDSIDTTRVGLYGAQPLGRFVLAGDFMLGFANNTATRPTGVGPAHATYSGTDYGGGVQLATQLDYNGVTVRPAAGIRFAAADSNGFSESGVHYVPAFAITGASSTDTSVQPYVKVGVARSFLTQSDVAVTPSASIGYTVEAGDSGKSVTVTSVDGTRFASAHTSLNSSAAEISLGLAAGKGNWSLYAHYTAYVAGNWTAQIGEAGLQVRF